MRVTQYIKIDTNQVVAQYPFWLDHLCLQVPLWMQELPFPQVSLALWLLASLVPSQEQAFSEAFSLVAR